MIEIIELKELHHDIINKIVGTKDNNLNIIKQHYGINLYIDDSKVMIDNIEFSDEISNIFLVLINLASNSISFNERDLIYIIKSLEEKKDIDEIIKFYHNRKQLISTNQGKPIYPKTINQTYYIKNMEKYDLVFGIGPAGTGKTYLAVAYASYLLKSNKIKKIILTRPVVEAGESLGFLPGDIKEKIDPYLIPLYDALYEFLGKGLVDDLINKGVIEIAPLAYMRGRTLDNAFIILDEAQNTTKTQMKMFLTRLGFNSKMVITGDPTQVDLRSKKDSGLLEAINILTNMKDVKFNKFLKIDVIRNPLVQKILERYEDEN